MSHFPELKVYDEEILMIIFVSWTINDLNPVIIK